MDLSTFLTGKNLLVYGGVIGISYAVSALFTTFFKTPKGQRLLPVLPVLLGALMSTFLGVYEGAESMQERALLGVIIGFLAGHTYKIGRTTFGIPKFKKTKKDSKDPQPLNEEK